ncbi:helix-turn-helix domain-containing protein [Paenibacillus favisporus]
MVSPYQYLLQVRIGKAQELLLATNRPLADIAAEVGFEEYSHFLATFRKIVGMSPSHYRKNNSLYQ